MPELIDRNALICKQKAHADLFADSTVHDDIVRLDEATAALAEIINAPAVNRLIPCSERLPEQDKKYITYAETTKYCTHNEIYDDGRVNILYFDGKEWYDDECIYYNVTHWMPLPSPPESEVQE